MHVSCQLPSVAHPMLREAGEITTAIDEGGRDGSDRTSARSAQWRTCTENVSITVLDHRLADARGVPEIHPKTRSPSLGETLRLYGDCVPVPGTRTARAQRCGLSSATTPRGTAGHSNAARSLLPLFRITTVGTAPSRPGRSGVRYAVPGRVPGSAAVTRRPCAALSKW
jgi:hypothetical protein